MKRLAKEPALRLCDRARWRFLLIGGVALVAVACSSKKGTKDAAADAAGADVSETGDAAHEAVGTAGTGADGAAGTGADGAAGTGAAGTGVAGVGAAGAGGAAGTGAAGGGPAGT